MDLRGHGLSDAPTGRRYDPDAAGRGRDRGRRGVRRRSARTESSLAGHGFGGIVAAWAAAALGERCAAARARRRRLGGHRCDDRDGARRVPARARRAARGPAVDGAPTSPTARASIRRPGMPTRRRRPGRPSSRRRPGGSCRRRGRTPSPPASRRCSSTGPADVLATSRRRSWRLARDLGAARPGLCRRSTLDRSSRPTGHNLMRYRPDEVTAAILGR